MNNLETRCTAPSKGLQNVQVAQLDTFLVLSSMCMHAHSFMHRTIQVKHR